METTVRRHNPRAAELAKFRAESGINEWREGKVKVDRGTKQIIKDGEIVTPVPATPVATPVDPVVKETVAPAQTQTISLPTEIPADSLFVVPAEVPVPSVKAEPDPELLRELEEARKERDALASRIQETAEKAAELDRLRRQQELEAVVNLDDIDFNSVDKDDIKKAIRPIVDVLSSRQDEAVQRLREAHAAEMQTIQQYIKKSQQDKVLSNFKEMNKAIFKAIPDFESFRNSDAYKQYMARPTVAGAKTTYGDLAEKEYMSGNVDAFIAHMNHAREAQLSLEDVAKVSPSVSGSVPVTASDPTDDILTPEEKQKILVAYRTGKMSREAMSEKLSRDREARRRK